MPLTLAQVESLAPDQASLDAASKLTRPDKWVSVGRDAAGQILWGECQGSGSAPYRCSATVDDLGYRCSCPSRKFPCKHSLALFWRYAQQPGQFAESQPPEWVTDWLSRRRPKQGGEQKAVPAKPARSISKAGEPEAVEPVDEAKAERSRKQKERTQASRETTVVAALDELDQWLNDQLTRGLAHFPAVAREQCRTAARRLADGKAPGFANLLDALPTDLFSAPDNERNNLLIERLGGLHLLAQAYRHQDQLPEGLRQDVRRMTGWTVKREDLLGDAGALRVSAKWSTIAIRSGVEPDGLRRIETWLARAGEQEPRFALLLDFFPTGSAAAASSQPGDSFEADAVFYPSATPLRAVLDKRGELIRELALPEGVGISAMLEQVESLLAMQPFLDQWPVTLSHATVQEIDDGSMVLTDADRSIPIDPAQADQLIPLLGLEPITLAGLWNTRRLHLLAATTPIGPWYGY